MFIFIFSFLFASHSFAATDICNTAFRSSNVGCDDMASSHSSGGSFPLLFDAFNFNPSALPTLPTPVGVEAYYNESKLNVALIKGLQGAGFGASAKNTETTFFSGVENSKLALKNSGLSSYTSSSLDKYFNLGTALSFIKLPGIANLPLGLGARYNSAQKVWSYNPGFEIRTSYLTLGASFYSEKPKKYFDGWFYDVEEQRDNISLNSSLRIRGLVLDYSVIRQKNSSSYYMANTTTKQYSSDYTVITQILSGTYVSGMMSATCAYRRQNDSRLTGYYTSSGFDYKDSHLLLGGAYKTDKIELGAFYNYVLNEDVSMLVKLFF